MLHDITMQEYLTHPGISSSKLKYMLQTPADFKASLDQDSGETKATVLGTAVHCAILEPHLFDDLYALQPADWGARNKGVGNQKWRQFKADNAGKIWITWEDRAYIDRVRKAAENHPYLKSALKNKIGCELSGFCETNSPLLLKARTDLIYSLMPAGDAIADIKTTSKGVSDDELSRLIFSMGYHFQAAHHTHVMQQNQVKEIIAFDWIFITTGTPAPHIIVKRASTELLAAGRKDFEHALKHMEECANKDEWPGYPQQTSIIGLPSFAERYY